jgi:hypothetical protein
MPVQEFAKIIEAVGHEPLGLLSLAFLVLGSIAYRLVKTMRKPTPNEVAVLLAIIFLGFAGVALALVRASNSVSAQAEAQKKPPSYTAVLKFTGQRRALQPAEVSFRNSSGQVNFGCNESRSVNVAWNAPPGAEQINATASWVNTDNVRSQDQHVVITGNTAAASGVISGRDREWTGNCPGGGHGELLIQGTYRIMQPTAGEPFESVQSGSVSKDKPLVIPLPTEEGLQINACEATVVADGVTPAVLRVAPVPASGTSDVGHDSKGGFDLSVNTREATLTESR